ncbi:MAG: acyltransferase, partial [Treponema sp.]|nr:acyltransferase [Treponema sp.]
FALFSFYKRRFLRLYPPLVLCILFTLPFTFLLSSDFIVNIGRQITAALGFVTNYFEVLNGGSYESRMLPHLFLHTWFLAVEVHLYLLWALFCACITLLLRKLFQASAGTSLVLLRLILIAASVTGAVFSYLRMQTIYNANIIDPSPAYFDTGARAFTFLLGACAGSIFTGTISGRKTESPFLLRLQSVITILGMVLLTGSFIVLARTLTFSGEASYRYGFAIASFLAILFIFAARFLHKLTPDINEPRAMTMTAALSYNIYLFHWPLYIVLFYTPLNNNYTFWNNNFAAVAATAAAVVFSAFVFFCLEPLFRRRLPLSKLNSSVLRRSLYAVFLLIVITAFSLNGIVFARVPEISSLEEQLLTGYLYQDADEIGQIQRLTKTINGKPLAQPKVFPVLGTLQNRTFTGNLSDPDLYELSRLQVTFNSDGILNGVTVVGDSVSLGARKKLTESIPDCYVDAEGSRQMWQGYNLIMALQKNHSLREYVVVSLGTNQNINSLDYINKIIDDLQSGHRLIFVTPYNAAMNESWMTYKIMQYLRTLPDIHPFITVADWALQIDKQPQLLGSDKVHIGGNTTAINLYINCIINAINNAAAKPAR